MEDIYPILDSLDLPGKKVLATIIHVVGSAYKKEGSSMLFMENGEQIGMISAGCLEEDLALRAKEVMETGKNLIVQFDLSDESDLGWGQGAGCNGMIEISMELIDDLLEAHLLKLKHLLHLNIPVLVRKKQKEYLYIPQIGEPFGQWREPINAKFSFVESGIVLKKEIYQHVFHPKPRLIIFGGGQDVRPICSTASRTGFSVTICDWSETNCNKVNFPDAHQLLIGFPKEIITKISFTPYDFIVIATHHFQKDRDILLNLPFEKMHYIGVLGSKERIKRLIEKNQLPHDIHSPIGLPIGAKGPEEIAISIIAELIKEWHKINSQKTKHF
ncbi:MAG: XdhC family protein [Bacillota bacterium]|nr:XdhC family protein [Bacillota bacterium]